MIERNLFRGESRVERRFLVFRHWVLGLHCRVYTISSQRRTFGIVPRKVYYSSRDIRCESFQGRRLKGDSSISSLCLAIALPGLYDILANDNFNIIPPKVYYGPRDLRCESFQGRRLTGLFWYFVIGPYTASSQRIVLDCPAEGLQWFSGY
jgi:hypothetical protein